MKKRLILVVLTVLTALCLCFAFTACDSGGSTPDTGTNSTDTEQGTPQTPDKDDKDPDVDDDKDPDGEQTDDDKPLLPEEGYDENGLCFRLNDDGESYSVSQGTFSGTSIEIPSTFNGVPVTLIEGYAFSSCSGLTSIEIPDSVTSIGGGAFYWCSGLTSVTIPDSVTSIGIHAFAYCSGLTKIVIPDSVTSIGERAFYYCSGLTSIEIPDSVISIGYSAFGNCIGMKSVTIGSGVTSIGSDAFWNCSGLMRVYIHDLLAWFKIDFWDYDANPLGYAQHLYVNHVELKELTIPDEITEIKRYAFSCCSSIESITIPDSVTKIGESVFSSCNGLKQVHISDLTSWCRIDFADSWSNPLLYAHHLYVDNMELEELIIPNEITEIKPYAFYNCDGLTSVTIGSGVTSIGNFAFTYCSGLTSITIPDGVTEIGDWAFYDCSGLTGITIPESVTSIGGNAFYGCDKIIQKEGNVRYVDQWAIGYDSYATEIALRAGTKGIADSAFSGCTTLKSVTIPESVMYIGQYAFKDCPLENVTVQGSTTWQVSKTNDFADTATVNVTDPANYVDYFTFDYFEYYWKRIN